MSYSGTYVQRATQNIHLLNDEIRTKKRRRLRHASIAIVGFRQTGKKTLACRFGAMNQGPFEEEVPSRYSYMAYFDLDTRLIHGTGDVFLRTYVVPPPSDLPMEEPPRYVYEMYNFSAMIFICSVVVRITFERIIERIHDLQQDLYRNGLPYYLVVGNKMDVDRTIYLHHYTFAYGLLTTSFHFGAIYEECSAKQNVNVNTILEEILLQIVAEQP